MDDFFTPDQLKLIAAIRDGHESDHGIDTSKLSDLEMWARIGITKEIMGNRGIPTGLYCLSSRNSGRRS